MDSKINIEDIVKSTTKNLGIDYDSLKPKTKKHLINIEQSISNRESMYVKLKNELKDNKITLSSITEDAGISSRQTVYNNPELKLYASLRMNQVNELNPYYLIDELKSKIDDLNEQLHSMVIRDIDTEILRHEVKHLIEMIKNRENSILTMEEQAKEMRSKIQELRKTSSYSNSETPISKGTVLTFDKNK